MMRRIYAIWIIVLVCGASIVIATSFSGKDIDIKTENTTGSISQSSMQEELKKPINKINEILVTRTLTDSISLEEMRVMRDTLINDFISKFGKPKHPIITAEPEVPEGAYIVAFGFKIYSDGMTMEYVGIAGDAESVPIIHQRAQKWRNKEILGSNAYWGLICMDEGDYFKSPYGGVTNNFECRYLYNDTSPSRDWFAIKQEFEMVPGCVEYGSSWKNKAGYPKHDWSASTLGNPQLHEHDPLGTFTGTQTISVSISSGGATWSWSYTQPDVTTYDYSSTNTEIAKWKMVFNSDASKTSTGGMKPGSSCGVNQHISGTYRILDLEAKGEFANWLTNTYLTHLWHINVTY